jgi:hypothetical protein
MRRLLAVSIVLIVAGCTAASSASPPAATPTPSAGQTATSSEPTDGLGPFSCTFPQSLNGATDRAQISGLRGGAHAGYDRIVFEFSGSGAAGAIPAIELRVGTPPFTADPSGLPINVRGVSFLILALHGASMVDPDGNPTYTGTTDFKPGLPVLQELAMAGDFEAVSTWIAGLTGPACARVTVVGGPNRLVIDLAAQ